MRPVCVVKGRARRLRARVAGSVFRVKVAGFALNQLWPETQHLGTPRNMDPGRKQKSVPDVKRLEDSQRPPHGPLSRPDHQEKQRTSVSMFFKPFVQGH